MIVKWVNFSRLQN